jgi:hypothetical protein
LWQILGIFGNVLEWKNVFSVHLNFIISEEIFFFAILVILFLKIAEITAWNFIFGYYRCAIIYT